MEVFFSSLPPQLHRMLREQPLHVLEGITDSDTATDSFYTAIESDLRRWLTLLDDFVAHASIWARVVGCKQGRAARCSRWLTAPMWDAGGYFLTSVALVVAVRKVLRCETREPGFKTAEKAFEPRSFFDEVIAVLPDPPPNGRFINESFEWLE